MSDASIFSAIEYIGREIHKNHLEKIINETVSISMFEREMQNYATKTDIEDIDVKVKKLEHQIEEIENDLKRKHQTSITMSNQIMELE